MATYLAVLLTYPTHISADIHVEDDSPAAVNFANFLASGAYPVLSELTFRSSINAALKEFLGIIGGAMDMDILRFKVISSPHQKKGADAIMEGTFQSFRQL
ncbi:hypothetical protein HK096_000980 [Nowakowskiella sp. JEL0078]|nr:hypothetical protein HK096_000980 [Nowakowskiella sp. JEL0078]